ncbi:Gamma-glutamylputrescine oxidoreductase [Thiomonas arsenitoxydans]|uniref:FAD dependent oxidoreductase n=1 Tax=Thiomonas arsenitoxydans (strain DSM 22701 / CIP 110005 / 3As) TaxID=426114 RepID=D6CQQ5_THIA3|nr:FAD-binding oxidoreductase [Thiomonas arsenitoxydans]CAZ86946.1 putative FAD dependent oxidoreductase [Thiomonas arsenitoxydans]CQR27873.1 Gamma-glutamylputrescine oxidoreductase [Thiomonas arsenitoxydans]CQR30275.1 Gamma-glutamylputrescine oxidoreductase [Thiomonas arsenitoxydans]CQR32114.1 Gamma-glutamylputrescine oxidoreductase [Thiomonas arsenitoxydans]CQR34145.1 Gamma-glutamylputrescine oxidoreductase [Thiomonas arsenitoxydans]
MMRLEQQAQRLIENSYYVDSAQAAPRHVPLQGEVQADVCIVGGGLAGLSAALELRKRGMQVVLLEGRHIGWGASGRNGGQALAGYASEMEPFERQLGAKSAHFAWEMSLDAIRLLRERIAQYAIDCDWTPGVMSVAVTPKKARALHAWAEHMQREYGYTHLQSFDAQQTRSLIASKRYCAAVLDDFGGHLHPLNYTLGLGRAALNAGVVLHEQSPVISVKPAAQAGGGKAQVQTAQGSVRARHVLLAGNVQLGDVAPRLSRRIMPVGTYIIATEALGAQRAKSLVRNRACVCDTQFVLDYYRLTGDDRLLFGGRVSYSTATPRDLAATMRRSMLAVYPQLSDVKITHAWGGFVDITMNRAPDFGRIAPDVLYLQGFSGHGLALTGMAGQLAAEAIAGQAERFDLFTRLRHKPFPGGDLLRTPALVLGMLWYRLRDLV